MWHGTFLLAILFKGRRELRRSLGVEPLTSKMRSARNRIDAASGRRRRSPRRLWVMCWLFAVALHLTWVPNFVWFMAAPPEARASVVEVQTVHVASEPVSEQSEGRSERGRREPEIELPGTAPGGSTAARAALRHEWERDAARQQQSWAPRAQDWAVEVVSYRPALAGRHSSPNQAIAMPRPAEEDNHLRGAPTRDDSQLRRRGESNRTVREALRGAGGVPSSGREVPRGRGEDSQASAGSGSGSRPRAAKRGARPRRASPHVPEDETSADAARTGPLAGMQPARQAAPEQAWTNAPVREARSASRDAEHESDINAGRVRRPRAQGGSAEASGPGRGGRGRGRDGAGRASSSLLPDYFRDVRARVGRHQSYPEVLEYDLQQGLVVLRVRVRHDGRVDRVDVQRSSGFELFDADAIRAVRRASPLSPPPPEAVFRAGGEYLEFTLPIRYRNPMFD